MKNFSYFLQKNNKNMRNKLNHEWINSLVAEGKSYKDVVEITGYNKNSVYGYCIKKFGKLEDRAKTKRQTIGITQEQKEYLFGTLMGDGNLQLFGKNKLSAFGRTNHSIKQLAYCTYKRNLLKDLVYDVKTTTTKAGGKEYQ